MATKKKPKATTSSSSKSPRRDGRDRQPRKDGWTNDYTGHGTSRDRRSYTGYSSDVVTDLEAIAMWRSDDLIARIIEMLPREAMRRKFSLKVASKSGSGKELSEKVLAECERLNVSERIKTAGQWERAYGGAAILPVIDGAVGDLEEPMDGYMSSIGKVTALHMLEPRELRPASWYGDIKHPKFRQPETYRLWPLAGASGTTISSEIIHESRLILFPGIRISNQLQPAQRPGWGDSTISRCRQVVADFGLAWGSAASLLHDFAQGVLKLKDLAAMMSDKNGEAKLATRLRAMDMARSTLRTMCIDGEDEFSRTSTPISGMDGMLIQLAQRLAAAADMPVTFLMGMSPAGMNATGDADVRSWYDRVEALRAYYQDMVEKLLRFIILQNDGPLGGKEPSSWSIEWPPLWQPSEKEEADRRQVVATTDNVYFQMGAVTAEQVARARWGGDTYSAEMQIDWESFDKQKQTEGNPDELSPEDLAAMGHDPATEPEVDPAAAAAEAAAEYQQTLMSKSGAILEIVKAVVDEDISRESGKAQLVLVFALTPEQAEEILGPEDFEPAPPAAPFGGAAPPFGAKPGEPVDEPEEPDEEPEPDDGDPTDDVEDELEEPEEEETEEPDDEEPDEDEKKKE